MRHSLLFALLLGCGDDPEELRVAETGARLDAGARDGGMDARGAIATSPPSCLTDVRSFPLGQGAGRSFSALVEARGSSAREPNVDGERLHLALAPATCAPGTGVRYLNFLRGADAGASMDVDSEDCLPVREPTLLLHGDQLTLYFGSDRGAYFDLYETAPQEPMRSLLQRSHDAAFEVALGAAALGPKRTPMLAYVAQATETAQDPAPIRVNDREVLPLTTGHHAAWLALARREDGLQQGRGLLGWASDSALHGVFLRVLSETGEPSAEPVKLSEGVGPIAFAARSEAVGVFYGDPALRYRALGSTLGSPTTLSSTTVRALSAVSYRTGFAVAYRDDAGVQALTLSLDGRITARASLKDAPGRDVQLLEGAGTLIAVWDEQTGDAGLGATLQVATIGCL